MITTTNLIEIYYFADEFCKEFDKTMEARQIDDGSTKKRRKRLSTLNDAEIITILVAFHLGAYRNLKHFYTQHVQIHMKQEFPQTVSYNRFVELQQKVLLPMTLFLRVMRAGSNTGISFIDSTPIRVCKNKRIYNHKVFKDIAQRGKSTMGYFFGFKLHIVVNDKGEIIEFMITPGNVDDRDPLKNVNFLKKLKGKLFADKGYVSQTLFEILFLGGIQLVTGLRRNMKNQLMSMNDKILLRKRSVIETINDELKNMCQIEHSRHRSFTNFIANLISGLLAYSYFPKKPSIKYKTADTFGQLALF